MLRLRKRLDRGRSIRWLRNLPGDPIVFLVTSRDAYEVPDPIWTLYAGRPWHDVQ